MAFSMHPHASVLPRNEPPGADLAPDSDTRTAAINQMDNDHDRHSAFRQNTASAAVQSDFARAQTEAPPEPRRLQFNKSATDSPTKQQSEDLDKLKQLDALTLFNDEVCLQPNRVFHNEYADYQEHAGACLLPHI